MIRRFLQQRGIRKLRRNRMAMGALAVIGVYVAIALSILLFDVIDKQATVAEVGPATMAGLFATSSPEKRLETAAFYLENLEKALDEDEPAEAVARLHFAELRVADRPLEELREIVERGWALYDELAASANLNIAEDVGPQLTELEAVAASGWVEPEGLSGLVYDLRLALGTDRQGRSILVRAVYSIKVATQIGVVAAFISVVIGTLLGGAAAFLGSWVDHTVVWLYSTFSSIPYIILLMVLAAVFHNNAFLKEHFGQSLLPVYAAFCMSFWIGPCRVVRGEVMKIKELEYVQAATAVGFGRFHILLKHVIPNTVHLMFINFSLLFIGAIKAEVILSFLGLGVKNEPSWGVMINHAKQEVINGFFWQIGAATFFMVVLVLAFNTLSDALQDAFDPKHV